jgi:asparagine synthetase B (glutamine-hydrolysing)
MKKFALVFSENNEALEFTNLKKTFKNISEEFLDEKISFLLDGVDNFNYVKGVDGFLFSYANNSISYVKKDGAISISTDVLGGFPIYYSKSRSALIVSNHMKLIHMLSEGSLDNTGIFQFVCSAYTLADTTLYQDIKQLRPGNKIQINTLKGIRSFQIESGHNMWQTELECEPTDAVIDEFIEIWKAKAAQLEGYQLMMSAGWDSRTLMSGVVAAKVKNVTAYTHGDTKSREIFIANRICNTFSMPHQLTQLSENLINLDLITRMLADSDTCMFPHWRVAAEYANEHNRSGLSGGIFGEIIGGHYGILSVLPQREQYKAMSSYMFGVPSKYIINNGQQAKDFAISALCAPKFGPMWCFSDDFNQLIKNELAGIYKEKIAKVISSYYEEGVTDLHRLVERFQVEHRARQYINCQLSVGLPVCGVNNPFADQDLVRMAVSFPIRRKLHNQLNIKIIKKLSPHLLDYSMAATLIPAKYPFMAQEASRVLRKIYEKGSRVISKGTSLSIGWNNFDFLIKGNFIPDLIDSLNSDIWNKHSMVDVFAKSNAETIYPILDMFLKIKTVDSRICNY